jgi:hypothetical protein
VLKSRRNAKQDLPVPGCEVPRWPIQLAGLRHRVISIVYPLRRQFAEAPTIYIYYLMFGPTPDSSSPIPRLSTAIQRRKVANLYTPEPFNEVLELQADGMDNVNFATSLALSMYRSGSLTVQSTGTESSSSETQRPLAALSSLILVLLLLPAGGQVTSARVPS